jgi:GT2 family glycosyltransferase
MLSAPIDVSVVIVSFNTRELLRECLRAVVVEESLNAEVLVVDNASSDGSAAMVAEEFPWVRLTALETNVGFAAANNVAFRQARGRYVTLLNSDAFLGESTLSRAIRLMDSHPGVGLAGARLIGRDGHWQPSARLFPSLTNDLLALTGLSVRFAGSRLFGRADRSWADPAVAAETDWVPGAFSIIRRSVLEEVGHFDERFFLYYEEVDLCRRIKAAGFGVAYWPELQVVHIGGESSKTIKRLSMSSSGAQLSLWRMRSALLYYRKHHSHKAWLAMCGETLWHQLRRWRNARGTSAEARAKRQESEAVMQLYARAWQETNGGRVCPPRPW